MPAMRSFSLAMLLLAPLLPLRADEPAVEVQPTDPKAAKIVLWSAGVPVPKEGAPVELKKEDLGKYLRKASEKK